MGQPRPGVSRSRRKTLSPPAIPGTRIHVTSSEDRPVIIDRPSLVHGPTRLFLAALTAALWIGWVSFWLPAAEAFGLPDGAGLASLVQVLPKYSFFITLMAVLLLGWAGTNWLRFAQKERRTARPPVPLAARAGHFGVDPDELVRHHGSARLEISYDEAGRIIGIRSGAEGNVVDLNNLNN